MRIISFKVRGHEFETHLLVGCDHGVNSYLGIRSIPFLEEDQKKILNDSLKARKPGSCMTAHTAHNVEEGRYAMMGIREYYKYMKSLSEFERSLHPKSPAGMAISYKKINK